MIQQWPPDDPPRPVWRPYGDDPLPSAEEALARPLWAFPSWFLRIECERCGKVQLINEIHMRIRPVSAAWTNSDSVMDTDLSVDTRIVSTKPLMDIIIDGGFCGRGSG